MFFVRIFRVFLKKTGQEVLTINCVCSFISVLGDDQTPKTLWPFRVALTKYTVLACMYIFFIEKWSWTMLNIAVTFFLSCKMISTYNYVVRNLPVSPAPLVRSHGRRSNIHQLYSVTAHHTIRVLNSIFIWSSYTYIRQSANMWLNSVHLVLIFYMLYIFISMSY